MSDKGIVWSRIAASVQSHGLASISEQVMLQLKQNIANDQVEARANVEMRQTVYRKRQRRLKEAEDRRRVALEEQTRLAQDAEREMKKVKVNAWYEKLKERDRERIREKLAIVEELRKKKEQQTSIPVEIIKPVRHCRQPSTNAPSVLSGTSLSDAPPPRTPGIAARTTPCVSSIKRFHAASKSSRKNVLRADSAYASSTRLAASVYNSSSVALRTLR